MTGVPAPVLAAYDASAVEVRPLGAGLINQTYLVDGGPHGRFVLQRLHPVFPPQVNEDIDAVTKHLQAAGLVTPRLMATRTGDLWVTHEGAVWRALTWVDGIGLDRLRDTEQAREAGRILAVFHRAVSGLRHEFRSVRPGVHDTARHLANLRAALETHRDHPRFATIAALAGQVLEAADGLEPLPTLPARVVHGDPKLNNILFSPDGTRALCLIDLDTLGRMALPLELGDAFRSWCNPAGEDSALARFSPELFEAAIGGYASGAGGFVSADEWEHILGGTLTIYVELAARFCADALNESYFGWNPQAFASRSEHNQVRAESQLNAARSLLAQRPALERVLRRVACA
ncbi:MAG: phosphotransferase [Gammaproteobacteria bacterium]|nr:MAG: phosphotransferase [Gammaproteobacteria bacterium]